jgi:hypothetical protein
MNDEKRIARGLIKLGKNLASLRYDITPEFIKKLPVKRFSSGAIAGKLDSKYFNPIYFYPEGVKKFKFEVGHDKQYRYVLKVTIN